MLRIYTTALILLLCPLLCACEKEKEHTAMTTTKAPTFQGTIAAVGDSLTAGYNVREDEAYPAQLEKKLHQAGYNWRVVNAGISGETSSGTLSRADWILKLKPDIVILETGANDGLRGVDPDLTRRNIDKIVVKLQGSGAVVLLAGMRMLTNMGPAYTAKFAAIYPQIAKEHNLILVPFFLDKVSGDESLNLSDGIHPTGKGYAVVTENVYPYLLQAIKLKAENR